jgi:hypothetical protein
MKKQYETLQLQLYLYNEEDIVRVSGIEIDATKIYGDDRWPED